MKGVLAVLLISLTTVFCYTKYGRSCKDINCVSNEVCVMESDPCSYYQRQGECGSYPTCKKTGQSTRTCSTFVCPPSQVCKMDGSTPKCIDDHSKSGLVSYDTHNANVLPSGGNTNPNAPPSSSGSLYPNIPKGETTERPNIHRQHGSGGGYQGGQIGSGYPGQGSSGYPQQSGYPGYPQQGYPQQGNPQQGYPGYQGNGGGYPGYPNYPQGGYQQPGGYQGGYYPQNQNYPNQNRYGQKSQGSSLSDKITDSLKTIGTNLLKDYLSKALSGNRN